MNFKQSMTLISCCLYDHLVLYSMEKHVLGQPEQIKEYVRLYIIDVMTVILFFIHGTWPFVCMSWFLTIFRHIFIEMEQTCLVQIKEYYLLSNVCHQVYMYVFVYYSYDICYIFYILNTCDSLVSNINTIELICVNNELKC